VTKPLCSARLGLRRTLSLPLITLYGLGNILGAGIYVLIGKIVGHAGELAPLSFLLASLLAGLTAFSYAELSARYPLSAGEAVYVQKGFGLPALAAFVGLLIVFAGVVSSATILRGFVGYLQVFVPASHLVVLPLLVIVLGGLAAWGISQSVFVASLFTLVEIFGLVLIVALGAPGLLEMRDLPVTTARLAEPDVWPGVLVGAFLAFYAFIGFEDMVNVAEEVRDPQHSLPRAIFWSIGVSTTLYFVVALVAVAAVPAPALAASDAPLALIYETLTGRTPLAITVIGMLAVVNGALIQIIMASRVWYGMSDRGWLPGAIGRVHPKTRTPLLATALVALLVLALALWSTIETLAKATSFALLLVFALCNLALWRLKGRTDQPQGIINVPRWVPAVGFAASLGVFLIQLVIDIG
jgi:amino acid transporter